jgi:hypothetical protein
LRAGFPHSEILGSKLACQLPEAYRRLQRPSSPVVAKASTTCTCSLDPITLSTTRRDAGVFGSRLAALRPTSRNANAANAISYPDEPGLRKPDSLHFFRIVKEQPNKTYCAADFRWALSSAFTRKHVEVLVEPTGIEPVTSCLQSRRSPS